MSSNYIHIVFVTCYMFRPFGEKYILANKTYMSVVALPGEFWTELFS